MSRRGKKRPHNGISLFAFLDVLICTMGALIVLLMVLMRQASADANTVVENREPPPPAIDESALRQQLEDAEWRRQLLEQQRLAKAEELSTKRLELSHLEDHIRRLEDKWKDLEAQAAQFQSQGESKSQELDKVASDIAATKAEIDKTKRDLEIARAVAAGKPRSFCIVPYAGPNGTSRRPIYIECQGDLVVIQPEGVTLDARDFEGPLGPGNPLDACLRATREYLARNPEMTKYGEPYPLLIVRPNGIVGYAAARAAMKSWEDEFGYELIEDTTELAYPAADPTLKAILERSIVDARRRQDLLAAAAPSRYRGTASGEGLRASPHGGFRDMMPDEDYGEGGIGGGNGGGNNRANGIGRGGGGSYNSGYAGGRYNSGRPGGTGNNTGSGNNETAGAGGINSGTGRNFGGGEGQRNGGNGGGGNQAQGSTQPGGSQQGGARGGPTGSSGGQAGPNMQRGSQGGQTGGQQGGVGQAGGGQSGGQPGGQPGGQAGGDADSGATGPQSNAQPIAHRRGANWGLPNYTAKATGITRPIRIRVEPGQLLMMPERGDKRGARVVPIEGSMTNATEELVSQIWDEVEGWGIAVAGGYWKPVLNVETAPGAEARFAELETLLDGSGLEVRRKTR